MADGRYGEPTPPDSGGLAFWQQQMADGLNREAVILGSGKEITDTYHESREAALDQANWEFDVPSEAWQVLSDG